MLSGGLRAIVQKHEAHQKRQGRCPVARGTAKAAAQRRCASKPRPARAGPHTCKTARGACLGGPGPGKAGVAESRQKPWLRDSARVGPGGQRQGTSAGDERHGTSAERQENLVSIEPKSTPTPTCVRRPLGKGPRGLISRMDNTGNRLAVSQRDCPAKAGAATLASAGRAKAGADFGQRLVKRERLKERQTPPIFERVRLLLCSVLSVVQMGKNGRANLTQSYNAKIRMD